MNIGKLDRRIIIQYPLRTKSSTSGEETTTWTDLATVFAGVTYPKAGSAETSEETRTTATIPVNFTIRYRSDIDESMRIYFESGYFQITRVNQFGRNEGMTLVTEKKV